MHDLTKLSPAQKEELRNAFERHFKTYILYSLYPSNPSSSSEANLARSIETIVKSINSGVFEPKSIDSLGYTIGYQKYTQLFERSDIKLWLSEVCSALSLSLCNVEDASQYDKDARVLFAELYIHNLDDSSIKNIFTPAMQSSKFGIVFMNNPDMLAWDDKKINALKKLLSSNAPSHNKGTWPLISLLNKPDPNLIFSKNFSVNLIDDSRFTKSASTNESESGVSSWFGKLFGKSKSAASAVINVQQTKEIKTIFDIIDSVESARKSAFVTHDSDFEPIFDKLITHLKIISKRIGTQDVQKANPTFFFDCKKLLCEDIAKIIEDYAKIPAEYRELKNKSDKTAKELALGSLQDISSFIQATSARLVQDDLRSLQGYSIYINSKISADSQQATPELDSVGISTVKAAEFKDVDIFKMDPESSNAAKKIKI